MKTLYLDIFSGISGDMFLGALLDLGVQFSKLERELQGLKIDGYHLHSASAQKCGIEGVKFDVHVEDDDHEHEHSHRHDEDEHHHAHHHHHHHHHDEDEHEHDHHHHGP